MVYCFFSSILFNVNTTSAPKTPQKLLNGLAEIKQVSKSDLKHFLSLDHTSFTTLSVSTKHIESTDRIAVTLSKPSAKVFYFGQEPKQSTTAPSNPLKLPDDCLTDAQHCTYFSFFNSKEKKLYTRFLDDTPGIGDTKLSQQEILDIIAEAVYLAKDGVSQILFVTNG